MMPLHACVALLLPMACVVAQDPALASRGDRTPPGRITGRVLDALGDGLAVVEVVAVGDADAVVARTFSDGDGMFVLSHVPIRDGYVVVRAQAPGRTRDVDYVRLRSSAPNGDAELRLWDAGTIRVRVVDPAGEPVAGAQVSAGYDVSRLFGFEPQAEAVTDDDGEVVLTGVPLGEIDVRAWRDGFVLGEQRIQLRDESDVELRIEPGDGVTIDAKVEGVPEQRTARVRVISYRNGSAQALPGALRSGDARDGTWSLRGLPKLEYRVSAALDGFTFAPSSITCPVDQSAHRLTFRATATSGVRVRGLLRDSGGRPLAGEALVCRNVASSTRGTAVTDEDGRFDVECPVPAGERAVLHLSGSSYVVAQPKSEQDLGSWDDRFRVYHEFVVDPDAELEVTAVGGAAVRGVVVDAEDRPVRGLRLELQEGAPNRSPTWMAFAYATTDRDGHFDFRGLNPPAKDLRVSPGRIGTDATEPFSLQAGSVLEGLRLVVPKTGIVEGVARDAGGDPMPGARVWLRNYDLATGQQTDGSIDEVLADREGRFRHIDVEPGGHLLMLQVVDSPFGGVPSDVFEVLPGARIEIDLSAAR